MRITKILTKNAINHTRLTNVGKVTKMRA